MKMLKIKPNNYIVVFENSRIDGTAHRPILGLLVGILLMILITLIAGCSQHCREPEQLAYEYGPTHVSPKLLLRAPGESSVDPEWFASRSDWPSVTGDVEVERVSTYSEYMYNRQSLTPGVPDYSYNLFQSYRVGINVR